MAEPYLKDDVENQGLPRRRLEARVRGEQEDEKAQRMRAALEAAKMELQKANYFQDTPETHDDMAGAGRRTLPAVGMEPRFDRVTYREDEAWDYPEWEPPRKADHFWQPGTEDPVFGAEEQRWRDMSRYQERDQMRDEYEAGKRSWATEDIPYGDAAAMRRHDSDYNPTAEQRSEGDRAIAARRVQRQTTKGVKDALPYPDGRWSKETNRERGRVLQALRGGVVTADDPIQDALAEFLRESGAYDTFKGSAWKKNLEASKKADKNRRNQGRGY